MLTVKYFIFYYGDQHYFSLYSRERSLLIQATSRFPLNQGGRERLPNLFGRGSLYIKAVRGKKSDCKKSSEDEEHHRLAERKIDSSQCFGSRSGSVLDPYSIGPLDPDPGGQK